MDRTEFKVGKHTLMSVKKTRLNRYFEKHPRLRIVTLATWVAFCCYLSWWLSRYLLDKFIEFPPKN